MMKNNQIIFAGAAVLFVMCVVPAMGTMREYGIECEVQNDCADEHPNLYCADADEIDNGNKSACVECTVDSHCGTNEFCAQRDWDYESEFPHLSEYPEGIKKYMCVKQRAPLGNKCAPAVSLGNVNVNESATLWCGLAAKWSETGSPEGFFAEWEGVCVDGRCEECSADSASTDTFARNRRCINKYFSWNSAAGTWAPYGSYIGFRNLFDSQSSLALVLLSGLLIALGVHGCLVIHKPVYDAKKAQ